MLSEHNSQPELVRFFMGLEMPALLEVLRNALFECCFHIEAFRHQHFLTANMNPWERHVDPPREWHHSLSGDLIPLTGRE